ncbi:MAG: hypothetical protein RIE73_32175 [Coleofasciculus sp. C1-SOL-03]|jgi:hypothetical protein|uniref:hypothetical protein n=1 Tax=Coleofasciculus sp. C1-SOL-03 TaxID=3069522 RepID=UPI0032F59F4B
MAKPAPTIGTQSDGLEVEINQITFILGFANVKPFMFHPFMTYGYLIQASIN